MRARGLRVLLASVRFRVVAGSVVLLALATTGSILVAREVVVRQIDDRIDAVLQQEVGESAACSEETNRPPGSGSDRTCSASSTSSSSATCPPRARPTSPMSTAPPTAAATDRPVPPRRRPGAHPALGLGDHPDARQRQHAGRRRSSTWRCPSAPTTRPTACSSPPWSGLRDRRPRHHHRGARRRGGRRAAARGLPHVADAPSASSPRSTPWR